MLACSFDEVARRIVHRGAHAAPFAAEADAAAIADAFISTYSVGARDASFFDIPAARFDEFFHPDSSDLMWAPELARARLIAFNFGEGESHEPGMLSDVWLPAGRGESGYR